MFGLAAFTLILPMTGVILFVMRLVVLSYREVVTVYTRAGGSYVVARENFGPRIAQVAAVALLIDYVVTVAVQVAAGTAAVVSAFPALGERPGDRRASAISVGVVLVMCYGNLRGIREAGKAFALPTYLFPGSVVLMIVVGLVREALREPAPQDVHDIPGHRPRRRTAPQGLTHFAHGLHAGALVRQRRLLADRHRGGVQRGQRVQAARGRSTPGRCWSPRASSSAPWSPGSPGWRTSPTRSPYAAAVPTVISQEADVVFGPSATSCSTWSRRRPR